MRILVFTGGLGNQMFEYAFYKHLESCFPKEKIYGHYGVKLKEHYGLEVNKWFEISLPPDFPAPAPTSPADTAAAPPPALPFPPLPPA